MLPLLLVLHAHAGDVTQFAGVWTWSGGAADEAARTNAIEATVARMPLLFRPFARSRIGDATPIESTLRIVVRDVWIRLGSGVESRWDGTPVKHAGDGGAPEWVTRSLRGDVLVHEAKQEDGLGREEYRVDGEALTVAFTVESAQLELPIRYTLHYRRQP